MLSFYVIFADFKSVKVIFIDFLSNFIDHFYNVFRLSKSLGHQNPGPDNNIYMHMAKHK